MNLRARVFNDSYKVLRALALRFSGSGELKRILSQYENSCNLCRVTKTSFHCQGRLYMKYGFKRPSDFRLEDVWRYCWTTESLWPLLSATLCLHLMILLGIYTKYFTLDLNSFWESKKVPYRSIRYQSWPCRKFCLSQCRIIIWTRFLNSKGATVVSTYMYVLKSR